MVRDTVREFVQNELVPIERDVLVREKGGMRGAPVPRDKRARLKKLAVEQGLWAMTVPEALGGGGLNALGACLVTEELGKSFVDFDFGDLPPMLFEVNAEQREKYLKPLIAGEKECVLALREPDADEFQLPASPEGDGWRLNGIKLAAEADLYLVYARTDGGATCFIVERNWEGVSNRGGTLFLEDVLVPAANVLGQVGSALALGKKYLNTHRACAAARQLGIAGRLLAMSLEYARDWKVLGQPLAVRPAVRRYLAEMAVELDGARWLVYHVAWEIDAGKPANEGALRASVSASEMLRRAVDRTIQIFGGPAHAEDLPILRMYSADGYAKTAEKILERQYLQVANSLWGA